MKFGTTEATSFKFG